MRKATGRFDALTSDSFVFHPDGESDSVSVPVAALLRLEISRGSLSRKNSAWKRAKWARRSEQEPAPSRWGCSMNRLEEALALLKLPRWELGREVYSAA
jgi:hypothetical protein